jgi:altronate hydrolase
MSEVETVARGVVIRLHPNDNVVVAAQNLQPSAALADEAVRALEPVGRGHKVATARIAAGSPVIKYGQVIGVATRDIPAGAHVHVHNLAMSDLRRAADRVAAVKVSEKPRTFEGYRRADGRVGVRNYVCVLTSVNCSATVARMIADRAERSGMLRDYPNVDGIVPITHNSGCGMASEGEGFDILRRTLWGTASNPNFGAILMVGLGCEVVQVARFAKDFALQGSEQFQSYTIQEAGGTRAAVEEGLERLRALLEVANRARRTTVPASELVLGLQCGGSDGWSGITSNPALGNASDRLVALGGTVMLSETPEIYGAEHLIAARAVNADVAQKLMQRIEWWQQYTQRHGATLGDNPSPGNIAGGITTILEKSLGAVAKAGTSPLVDVIEYAAPCRQRGFVFMDSPGFDPCSATGQVASGATMIAFTTGRGSAYGCKPSPSIKLASNSDLFRRMQDDMDIDCGPIVTGNVTVEQKGAEILTYLLDVASGKASKSEALGYGNAEFVPWIVGATM